MIDGYGGGRCLEVWWVVGGGGETVVVVVDVFPTSEPRTRFNRWSDFPVSKLIRGQHSAVFRKMQE